MALTINVENTNNNNDLMVDVNYNADTSEQLVAELAVAVKSILDVQSGRVTDSEVDDTMLQERSNLGFSFINKLSYLILEDSAFMQTLENNGVDDEKSTEDKILTS